MKQYNWSPNSIALKDIQRIKASCGKLIAFLTKNNTLLPANQKMDF